MRALIACLAAMLLAACATATQQNPVVAKASSGMIVAGTLSLGTCEMANAPLQTRIQVVVEKATRRLQSHAITPQFATVIADRAQEMRTTLAQVCPLDRAGVQEAAENKRDSVRRALPAFEALIPKGDAQ